MEQAVLKCDNCKKIFKIPFDRQQFPRECPYCHVQISHMTCNWCGHEWELRDRRYPRACPKCKVKNYMFPRPRKDNE